jgi:DNA-binding LacI/PurR family transcriptional regulator
MSRKGATRDDVARRAGVSKTAVTYALAGTPGARLSPATVRRVRAAARALGYRPNFAARSLVRGRTGIVGLLLPSREAQFRLYYSRMISGLLSASDDTPFHFLYLGQDHPAKYERCLEEGYLDGIVVLQSRTDGAHVRAVAERRIPAVTLNFLNAEGLPEVSADYEGSVDAAHRLLAARGARRIAFVCPRVDCQPNHRMIARHAEVARELAGGVEMVHVDLDGFTTVGEAWRDAISRGGFDGLVVDGLENGVELARLAAAASRSPGGRAPSADMVIFNTGEPDLPAPPGATVLSAPAEAVGMAAWRVMKRLLAGNPVERTTLVPFVGGGDTEGEVP